MRYFTTLFLKILSVITALLFLFSMILALRLSHGKIALDNFAPYFKKSLEIAMPDSKVDFKTAALIWRSAEENPTGTRSLQIVLEEITFSANIKNKFSLNIPKARLQISAAGLARGIFAPTFAEISGLNINYTLPKGVWNKKEDTLGTAEIIRILKKQLLEFQNSDSLLPRLIHKILSKPDVTNAAGYFEQFLLDKTTIEVKYEITGYIWKIPDAVLNVKRTGEGLLLTLDGDIKTEDTVFLPISLSVNYNNLKMASLIQLHFSEVNLALLSGKIPALKTYSAINLPFSGILDFGIDKNFILSDMDFELEVNSGGLKITHFYQNEKPIKSAALEGYISWKEEKAYLNNFEIFLQKSNLKGQGLLYFKNGKIGLEIESVLKGMSFDELVNYWPKKVAVGVREWIDKNIEYGFIPKGTIKVNIKPEVWNMAEIPADSFNFNFKFSDLTAHYLRPMPPLVRAAGSAYLNAQIFDLKIEQGAILNLKTQKASVKIKDIHKAQKTRVVVKLPLSGAMPVILMLLDSEPLGYASSFGIKEGSILGNGDVDINLKFPLIKALTLGDVEFDINADINDLTIKKLGKNHRLSDGIMNLSVNDKRLMAVGDVRLNDVLVKAKWTESFSSKIKIPTEYKISGIISSEEWQNFNLPFAQYLTGNSTLDLTLNANGGKIFGGSGGIDFTDSLAKFDIIGWEKEKNIKANTSFKLNFVNDDTLKIDDIKFFSEKMTAQMDMVVHKDMIHKLHVKNFKADRLDFGASMQWNEVQNAYVLNMSGLEFNFSPILAMIKEEKEENDKSKIANYIISGDFEKLHLENDIFFKKSIISAQVFDQKAKDLKFKARFENNKEMLMTLGMVQPKSKKGKAKNSLILQLNSSDAGQVFRAFDIFKNASGGNVNLAADVSYLNDKMHLKGDMKVEKIKVARSPVFAALLKEKEFAKAKAELEESGLKFDVFNIKFEHNDGLFKIEEAYGNGPTIGMTFSGTIDPIYDEVNLSGTIIPAYGLNGFFGKIPLIGPLLMGGKGQGLFAANFKAEGSTENPKLKVNVLSGLAPGFLRNIFKAFDGKKQKTKREKAEEEKRKKVKKAKKLDKKIKEKKPPEKEKLEKTSRKTPQGNPKTPLEESEEPQGEREEIQEKDLRKSPQAR